MLLAIGGFAPLALLTLRFHWLGLPGVWAALGLWLAARSVILGRRWAAHVRGPGATAGPGRTGRYTSASVLPVSPNGTA
jgi:Na+-driven multidrug efflux pump